MIEKGIKFFLGIIVIGGIAYFAHLEHQLARIDGCKLTIRHEYPVLFPQSEPLLDNYCTKVIQKDDN